MFQQAIGCEKTCASDHIVTAKVLEDFGEFYATNGKPYKAEQLWEQALKGYEKVVGPERVATFGPALETMFMGNLFACCKDPERARAMYIRSLAGHQKAFGDDHPRCQDIRQELRSLRASPAKRSTSAANVNITTTATSDSTAAAPKGTGSINVKDTPESKRRRLFERLPIRE